MKNAIILILLGFSTLTTFSQTEKKIIGVNKQYNTPDTTRTFCFISAINFDSSIDSLIKHWGTPAKNSVGNISWTNIDIPNIGTNLNILLTDGICTMLKNEMKCEYFKDNEDKEKKLNELKSNQSREVEIIITNKDQKKIIDKIGRASCRERVYI